MQTISLDEILAMPSSDASGYLVCNECFMPTWDSYNMPCYCDAGVHEASVVGDILAAKKRDGWYPSLCKSLDEQGMNTPILIINGRVYNGHHRIAYGTDRGLLEFNYTDDYDEYRSCESRSPW